MTWAEKYAKWRQEAKTGDKAPPEIWAHVNKKKIGARIDFDDGSKFDVALNQFFADQTD